MVKYANNYAVSRFLRYGFPFPYTQEGGERWINFVNNDLTNLAFAIADEKEIIKVGFVFEGVIRKNVFKENKFLDQYIYGLLKEDFKI